MIVLGVRLTTKGDVVPSVAEPGGREVRPTFVRVLTAAMRTLALFKAAWVKMGMPALIWKTCAEESSQRRVPSSGGSTNFINVLSGTTRTAAKPLSSHAEGSQECHSPADRCGRRRP